MLLRTCRHYIVRDFIEYYANKAAAAKLATVCSDLFFFFFDSVRAARS